MTAYPVKYLPHDSGKPAGERRISGGYWGRPIGRQRVKRLDASGSRATMCRPIDANEWARTLV
jgi:hypothetical protein